MTNEEVAIERERCVVQIDTGARDRGHVTVWTEEGIIAAGHCSACGQTAAVRVQAGGTWQAGQLRWSDCPARTAPE
jgi:hypothetical protein